MKKIIVLFCLLWIVAACSKEMNDFIEKNQESTTVILQERDQSLPKIWSKTIAKSRSSTSYLPAEDYLGYSYRIGNTIMGDNSNTGFAVVDIKKLEQTYPSYVVHNFLGNRESPPIFSMKDF